MPTFTWVVPTPPSPTPTEPASVAADEPADVLFGNLDQELDPATLDYVDTDDGGWSETASSRTAVMMQLSIRYNTWPADPDAGTRVPEMLESGEPVTPEMVVDDTRRALQVLVEDGIISDLSVQTGSIDEETGALEVAIDYTDVVTGHVVELVFSPF